MATKRSLRYIKRPTPAQVERALYTLAADYLYGVRNNSESADDLWPEVWRECALSDVRARLADSVLDDLVDKVGVLADLV